MHTLYINVLICFEHPSFHPQEDLYMQFYASSFMHPYKQSGRWQDVLEDEHADVRNTSKIL